MCGLVGGAGQMGPRAQLMVKTMLELDVLRGEDSTGIVIKNADGVSIHKEIGIPQLGLFYDQGYLEEMDKKGITLLLGHNRAATKGVINTENAHPFNYGDVYGAHNGTLHNYDKLDGAEDLPVDSMALFNHLSINGIEDTLKNAGGAYALTWYDSSDNTINFIRNRQRPLLFAYSKDKQMLFWASEHFFLTRAAKKAKVTLDKVHDFAEMHHYKVEVPSSSGTHNEKKFGKMRIKKYKGYTYVTTRNYSQDFGTRYSGSRNSSVASDNIFPINFRDSSKSYVQKLKRGDQIIFEICGQVIQPLNKQGAYIRGTSVGNDVEVRLFPNKGSANWNKFNTVGTRFSGKIKGIKRGYLLINMSTCKELGSYKEDRTQLLSNGGPNSSFAETEDYDPDNLLEVQPGEYMTRGRFKELMKEGCGSCGNEIEEDVDLHYLEWADGHAICEQCTLDILHAVR